MMLLAATTPRSPAVPARTSPPSELGVCWGQRVGLAAMALGDSEQMPETAEVSSANSSSGLMLSEIWRYPIKSCRGERLSQAQTTPEGLEGDRRFMVSTFGGRYQTQREQPALATLQPRVDLSTGMLALSASGQADFQGRVVATAGTTPATIFSDRLEFFDQGKDVGRWLTRFLDGARGGLLPLFGVPSYKLLYARPSSGRRQGLSDLAPVLAICEESLFDLNARRATQGLPAVRMDRFRPNLVLRNCAPLEEDSWCGLTIGGVTFGVDGPCPRCTVPDVNQDTGRSDAAAVGPMKSLRAYRSRAGVGVLFGAYLSPMVQGVLSPGQPVTVKYC